VDLSHEPEVVCVSWAVDCWLDRDTGSQLLLVYDHHHESERSSAANPRPDARDL
jgi:hypothetical protein